LSIDRPSGGLYSSSIVENNSPFIFYLFITCAFILAAALIPTTIFVWKRANIKTGKSALIGSQRELRWFLLASCIYLISNTFEILMPVEAATFFFAAVCYVFIAAVPTWWFLFSLEFTGRAAAVRRIKKYLWIVPVLAFVFAITNGYHHLLWREWYFISISPFRALRATAYGPWFWFLWAYLQALTLSGSAMVIAFILAGSGSLNRQSVLILLGTLVPVVVNAVYVLHVIPAFQKDFSSIAFGVSGLIVTSGVFTDRLFDLVPIARRALVEALEDPIVVVEAGGRIVDANAAAVSVCGLVPADLGFSRVEDHPFLARIVAHCAENDCAGRVEESPDGARWFEVRLNVALAGKRGLDLYAFRDVTERRRLSQDKAALAERLAGAQAEIRTLRGIIPVCSRCGTVRSDPDYRRKVEKYAESLNVSFFELAKIFFMLNPLLLKKFSISSL